MSVDTPAAPADGAEPRQQAPGPDLDAAFAAFDDMVEGWLDDDEGRPSRGARARPRVGDAARGVDAAESRPPRVVCARCHSLTHNGCARGLIISKLFLSKALETRVKQWDDVSES